MSMVITMLVLMGILTLTLIGTSGSNGSHGYNGILGMTDNALQASSARTKSASSFNMAESGVQYTLAWLSSRAQPPVGNAQAPAGWDFTPVGKRGVVTPDPSDPNSYFAVRIYPDYYNVNIGQKKYLIESVGVSGGMVSIVQAYVRQGSLAQYLVLLNSWSNSGNYWVSGLTTFDGPVHDNNTNGLPENILWKSAAGTNPMFTYTGSDAYTTSGTNGIAWWKDQFNTAGTPQVVTNADGSQTNQWLNVAAGGSGSVHTGTPVVPFPASSILQKNAATGGATVLNPKGVTLCPGGGVYVEGDVSEMALSAAGPNNTVQVMTITQGATVQRVTLDPAAGTKLETQQPNGTWQQVASLPNTGNGVVYVNGNVGAQGDPKTGGLHGQVADNTLDGNGTVTHSNGLTVVTPQVDAGGNPVNCNLDGSVTYSTKRQVAKDSSGNPEYTDVNGNRTSDPAKGTPVYVPEGSDPNFVSKAGTLGLISNNVLVTKQDSTGAALTNFEMDGTVLASGQYDADHFQDRPVGLWENMGGYLSQTVGTFGVFNNSLQLTNGFNTQFNYDARMPNNPPPFFPATGSTYSIISWHQVAQPLEP